MNESSIRIRLGLVAGRYQKILLAIIVGASLFGIAFQHYVRGPRQRLEQFRGVLRAKDWNGVANLYSEGDWRQTTWSKPVLVSFLKLYVEPKVGATPELQDSEVDLYGTPIRRVAIIDPASGKDLFLVEQSQIVSELFRYSGGKVVFPLRWQEECPTPRQVIQSIAPALYPHSDIRDDIVEKAVSEFEFLIAEHDRLEGIGIKYLVPAGMGQPPKTINEHLSLMRTAYSNVWEPFAKVEAKYSIKK